MKNSYNTSDLTKKLIGLKLEVNLISGDQLLEIVDAEEVYNAAQIVCRVENGLLVIISLIKALELTKEVK